MTDSQTRENWLNTAADMLFTLKLNELAKHFDIIPHPYKLSVGSIVGNAKAIGCCFPRSRSEDGINEIFFTPTVNDSAEILATMVHELIHALDDCQSGHKGVFARMAKRVGLVGKMTATTAGLELQDTILDIVDVIGTIPHSKLDTTPIKKQGTRSLLMECDSCDFRFRITQKHVDNMRYTSCMACDTGNMKLEHK